jgi:hypothetical protein
MFLLLLLLVDCCLCVTNFFFVIVIAAAAATAVVIATIIVAIAVVLLCRHQQRHTHARTIVDQAALFPLRRPPCPPSYGTTTTCAKLTEDWSLTPRINVRCNCRTHAHCLNAVNDVLYNIGCVLIDYDINRRIVGRASAGLRCNDHLHIRRESGRPRTLMVLLHSDSNSDSG